MHQKIARIRKHGGSKTEIVFLFEFIQHKLIVGAGENLGEVFLGPYVGGGIQTFFPYLLALIVLYFKPYGLFGKEIIERV